MKKRLLTTLLTAVILLTLPPTSVFAAGLLISPAPQTATSSWRLPKIQDAPSFPDVNGTWCEDYVTTVYQAGLMAGKTEAHFDAASSLTYAQITVVTARLHELLNGGDGILPAGAEGQLWYQSAVEYLNEHCDDSTLLYLLKRLSEENDRANTPCIRRDFIWMLAAVLPESALAPINALHVVPDTTADHVLQFYQAGILNGTDAYGSFGNEKPLTRGAAAAMLARIVAPEQRLLFTLKSFDLCRDVLQVEPDTVLLTIEGKNVTAELFANQLCTSLYQWGGPSDKALNDAIRSWCYYRAPFHVMAQEKGILLSAESLAEIAQEAQSNDGFLGLRAAYWQYQNESIRLNLALKKQYWEADWKRGEGLYHSDLEKRSEALAQNAVYSETLRSIDLSAVYQRLMVSPFIDWNF